MNRVAIAALLTSFAALCGCASVKLGEKDAEAKLKELLPISGKVSLYVCRESAVFFGAGVNTTVFVNNTPIGTLKPNTFAHTELPPGKHEIFLRRDGLATGNSGALRVDAKPGDVVVVWAGMTGGGFGALTVDNFSSANEGARCVKSAQYSVRSE